MTAEGSKLARPNEAQSSAQVGPSYRGRRLSSWSVQLWAVVLLAVTCAAMHGCYFDSGCDVEQVPFLEGAFADPTVEDSMDTTGTPLFAPFPRGHEVDTPTDAVSFVEPPTRTVPSARLTVDRASGIVTRSYTNAAGQSVVETYRIVRAEENGAP